MAYITAAEVIARIGSTAATQLTTDTGGSPDSTKITAIISEVEALVHSYLRKRTATPIVQSTHPHTYAAVRAVAMRLVIYQLRTLRPPVPEDDKENNAAAIKWLVQIAKGEVDLPDEELNPDRASWSSEDPTEADHDTMI